MANLLYKNLKHMSLVGLFSSSFGRSSRASQTEPGGLEEDSGLKGQFHHPPVRDGPAKVLRAAVATVMTRGIPQRLGVAKRILLLQKPEDKEQNL